MIWNLGSINIDNFYGVDHLPEPGETLSAHRYDQGLGGKGANMSIAIARAGGHVAHIGAVGPDGVWTVERLKEYGVDTANIAVLETTTGHANICVDDKGENNIVLFGGGNQEISDQQIADALSGSNAGDFLLMQNETNGQSGAANIARSKGLRVVYSAAPFDAAAVMPLLDQIDLMVLNAVEAEQLQQASGQKLDALGIKDIVITLGADGCKWVSNTGETQFGAYPATPVDTTGAGDTFTGYLVAGLAEGLEMSAAIDLAQKAGALMVARHGTGDVIPTKAEIAAQF